MILKFQLVGCGNRSKNIDSYYSSTEGIRIVMLATLQRLIMFPFNLQRNPRALARLSSLSYISFSQIAKYSGLSSATSDVFLSENR